MLRELAIALLVLAGVSAGTWSGAADLTVHVETAAGAPLEDAVVYAVPAAAVRAASGARYVIDQIDRQFVPRVNVVQAGTAVEFPNHDNIRHSVYSFSAAHTFNLKLYAGKATDPVIFDQAGLVVLGCNIHDSMVAWLLVVETPYFARTDHGGVARLPKLPAGEFRLRAWHAPMSEDAQVEEPLHVEGGVAVLTRSLHLAVPADPAGAAGKPK